MRNLKKDLDHTFSVILDDSKDSNFESTSIQSYEKALEKHAGISRANLDGKITHVNNIFCETSGYSRAELLGNSYGIINSRVHSKFFFKEMWDTILKGEIWRGEIQNMTKGGQIYHCDTIIVPVSKNDEIVEFVSMSYDVTEKKKKDYLYEVTSRVAKIGGWEYNVESECLSWTDETYRIHELPLESKIDIRKAISFYVKEDQQRVEQAFKACLEKGQAFEADFRIVTKNDNLKWVTSRGVPEINQKGETIKVIGVLQDVTDKKKSEIKLKSHEKRIKQIFDQSSDAMMILSPPDWKFTSCNQATLRLFGYETVSDFCNLSLMDVSPMKQPDCELSSEKAMKMINETLENGRCLFDWVHKKSNGEEVKCRVLLSRIVESGHHYIQATIRDNTAQKRLEDSLINKKRELEEAQSISKLGSYSYNIETKRYSWSKEMFNIFGFNSFDEEPSVKSLEERIYHKDQDKLTKAFQECIQIGRSFFLTLKVKNSSYSSGYSWVEIRGKCQEKGDNSCTMISGTCQDVTERVAKDKQLSSILTTTKTGLWKYDPIKEILIWDESMYDLFEIEREDFSGDFDAWINAIHPDYKENALKDFKRALEGNGHFSSSFKIITKEGTEKHIGSNAKIDRDKDGRATYVTGFNWDRTDEQEAIDQMQRQMKMTQHTARLASIGELAAGVGHEINNPLAIIKAYLVMLKTASIKSDNEYTQGMISQLEKIDKATERIANIVKGLRNFSRFDNPSEAQFNPLEALRESIELVREIYTKEGIDFCFNSQGFSQPIFVKGSRGKFQQIVMNLVSNARDALRSVEQRRLLVQTRFLDDNIILDVCDSGDGIEDNTLQKIFDPFFTTKDVNKGTGIGLSLVHKFVEELNGEIKVTSQVGEGTTFSVILPYQQGNSMNKNKQDDENLDAGLESGNSGKFHILLVDDEEDLRDVLALMLKENGLNVTTACDGKQAFDIYNENPNSFDLVISDVKMPVMDGPEFLRAIRASEHDNKPKFVFITGGTNVDFDPSKDEIFADVDGYFYKPFSANDVDNLVDFCKGE